MKSTQRATAAASLVAAVGLGTFCVAIFGLVAGCTREAAPTKSAEEFDARKPTLQFGERRIEVLIACYKAILLTQEKYGGGVINSQSTGIAAALEPARRMIEQRLVGDLTEGAEKMRINERIEASIDALVRDKPYASTEVLLNTARRCSDFETRNAWGTFPR
ncbi:MAG: hypothetical protein RLZZ372_181 [Pseudomonadota bacterium]|jgi:hypothetical protein